MRDLSRLTATGVLATVVSLLAACAVGPDYEPRTPAQLSLPGTYLAGTPAEADAADLARWWQSFDDPLLTQLVAEALASNKDLAAAQARLRVARASLTVAQAGFWPSLGASAGGSASEASDATGGAVESWQAGLDAAWELDVFGGVRRSAEASAADLGRARASLADVQRSIAAEVALDYIDARSAQARLAVARENLGYQDETVRITGWRHQAGLVGGQDVEQATVLRAQTAAAIPLLQTSYSGAANRLAVLLGQPPGAVNARLEAATPIPRAPEVVATGVPADLLRRRPDLVAAERTLAAEVARIGVAEADLLPALRLGGSLDTTALSVGDLGSVLVRSVSGGITAPLFQGGALRARLEGQRASADAALASYEGAVLQALQDVEDALDSIDATRERETQLAIAEEAARRSLRLADTRYRTGLIDFQSLLDAQRSLLSTQESRLSARAARAAAAVQLYKALGGGWSPEGDTTEGK